MTNFAGLIVKPYNYLMDDGGEDKKQNAQKSVS